MTSWNRSVAVVLSVSDEISDDDDDDPTADLWQYLSG